MTKMTQTAAIAAIGAASRELHLPTVRSEAERLAEMAERSRVGHLPYLADVLSAVGLIRFDGHVACVDYAA